MMGGSAFRTVSFASPSYSNFIEALVSSPAILYSYYGVVLFEFLFMDKGYKTEDNGSILQQ